MGTVHNTNAEQISSREYMIKAAFLYNFAKFIEWPPKTFEDSKSPVRLCVLGKNPFGIALESIEGKTIHGRKLIIEQLNSTKEIKICHMLFISESEKKQLDYILNNIKDLNVLTIGDTENFARLGVIINLTMAKKKIRFKINLDAANRAGLKISSKLLKLANIIQEGD